MAQVKFFRGNFSAYKPTEDHKDSIYFSKDTNELLLNGVNYGISTADLEKLNATVKGVELNNGIITISYTGTKAATTIELPVVSSEANGLMSKEDKAAFDVLNGSVDTTGSVKEQVNTALEAAKTYANDLDSAVDARLDALEALTGLGGEGAEEGKSLTEQVTANTQAIAAINNEETGILKNAKDYADGLNTAVVERVSTLESEMDSAESRLDSVEGAIDILNGTGDGSVDKKVATAIADVVASAPEDLDTLKEIADFIANDQEGAASLVNRISALEGIDHEAYKAADEVNLQSAKTYADGLNTAMDNRVKTLESADVYVKDDVDSAIADAKKAGTDAAEALETYKGTNDTAVSNAATAAANAQSHSEGVASNLVEYEEANDTRVKAIEDSLAETGTVGAKVKSNTDAITILNGTGEGSVSKAVSDVKATVDGYTVNGKAISTSPTLDATNIKLGTYTSIADNGIDIEANTTIADAIKALEDAWTWGEA